MVKPYRKNEYFYPKGFRDGPVPVEVRYATHPGTKLARQMYAPALGLILNVHAADSISNKSRKYKSDFVEQTDKLEVGDYFKTLLMGTSEKGCHMECDVQILYGLPSNVDTPILYNVPMCLLFGGIDNYGFVTPRAKKNTSDGNINLNSDGDLCIVQFLGGDIDEPFIAHIFPHPRNCHRPLRVKDGTAALLSFDSIIAAIKNGQFLLDLREAGSEVNIDAANGAISRETSPSEKGKLTVITKNDILLVAGERSTTESSAPITDGHFLAQSRNIARLQSIEETVEIHTKNPAKRVNIQVDHGNASNAARKDDQVQTSSELEGQFGGNLYSRLDTLYSKLAAVSASLTIAGSQITTAGTDPVLLGIAEAAAIALETAGAAVTAAAMQLKGLTAPSSTIGKITQGSDNTMIGGEAV